MFAKMLIIKLPDKITDREIELMSERNADRSKGLPALMALFSRIIALFLFSRINGSHRQNANNIASGSSS
jgi:hypothetical protein